MKKFFYGLLGCCLVFGFQSACGTVLCIGADGQVSIEMTCRTLAFPQQNCSNPFPLRSAILSDQDRDARCDQCVDIPIRCAFDGVRIVPSAPNLLLPPVHYSSMFFSSDFGRDGYKAANCWVTLSIPNHSISLLRTTVLLI